MVALEHHLLVIYEADAALELNFKHLSFLHEETEVAVDVELAVLAILVGVLFLHLKISNLEAIVVYFKE